MTAFCGVLFPEGGSVAANGELRQATGRGRPSMPKSTDPPCGGTSPLCASVPRPLLRPVPPRGEDPSREVTTSRRPDITGRRLVQAIRRPVTTGSRPISPQCPTFRSASAGKRRIPCLDFTFRAAFRCRFACRVLLSHRMRQAVLPGLWRWVG